MSKLPPPVFRDSQLQVGLSKMAFVADDLAFAAYIFSAVMFILALAGLNRPESSKAGNFYGNFLMLTVFVSVAFF
jgi:hypothetical protein